MTAVPDHDGDKPKLVFFRFADPSMPRFLSMQLDDHVRCLSSFFEVVVVSELSDYDEVCDRERPDLVLFESGVYASQRRVVNTHTHPDVPKLGFLNSDAYGDARAAFLSDMDRWGVETFFSLSVSIAEYTPEIADRLFIWPNSINPAVFRDYGADKNIPVLMTGAQDRHYPWRNRVSAAITANFPTLVSPHFGWENSAGHARMIVGERYARLINASQVVPTCGTIAKDVVRKHFEIPAARALMVTEDAAAIRAAGFADGVNCVFADAVDVVDRLDELFAHPEELQRITDAGHEFVQARHTWGQRDELRQWLRLYRALQPGERIVQTGPFEGLSVAPADTSTGNWHPISHGVDRQLLARAWSDLTAGRFEAAERLLLGCMNYQYLPEAIVALTHLDLRRNRVPAARDRIRRSILTTLQAHGAIDPDPVQWATWILVLLCSGDPESARAAARRFPRLRHQELDRMRRLVAHLTGDETVVATGGQARASMNPLPSRDPLTWSAEMSRALQACGRSRDVIALRGWHPEPVGIPASSDHADIVGQDSARAADALAVIAELQSLGGLPLAMRSKNRVRAIARRLTASDFTRTLERLVAKEPVATAIVLGRPRRRGALSALSAALETNAGRPPLVRLDRYRHDRRAVEDSTDEAGPLLIYVGGSHDAAPAPLLSRTRMVILESITSAASHSLFVQLCQDAAWTSVVQDQNDEAGFAVFRANGRL